MPSRNLRKTVGALMGWGIEGWGIEGWGSSICVGPVSKFARCVCRCAAISIIFFCLLIVGWSPTGLTASPYQLRYADPVAQPWRISRYRELEGRGVRCVTEDQQGNMWFGLQHGAVKYDGYHWQFFGLDDGLPAGSVEWLETRSDGSPVAATRSGLYQRAGVRWEKIFPATNDFVPTMTFVKETSGGTLWAGCDWGLVRLRDQKSTLFTSNDYARIVKRKELFDSVATIPDECLPSERLFRGTGIALLGRNVVHLGENSPAKAAGLRVDDRILDVNGEPGHLFNNLTRDSGQELRLRVERFSTGEIETIEFTTAAVEGRFRNPVICSLLEDKQNQIWVGARGGRVFTSDDTGEHWNALPIDPGLIVARRPAAIELSNGDICVVSEGRKGWISRFDGSNWNSKELSMMSGTDYVSSAAQTMDGSIWIGGLNRLHVYHAGEWKLYDTRDLRLPGESHRMFVASDDALWIVGYGQYPVRIAMSDRECLSLEGVSYQCTDDFGAEWFIETSTNRIVRHGAAATVAYQASDDVISHPAGIVPVDGGVVAFGRHGNIASLCTFDGRVWNRVDFPEVASGFSSKGFTVAKDGRVWIAATGNRLEHQVGGIVVGKGSTWQHLKPPGPPPYATSIVQLADGRMMVGGGFGIVSYDGDHWSRVGHELLDETPCPGVVLDAAGTVWVATRTRGVLRYRNDQWQAFTSDQGLSSHSVDTIAVGRIDDIWVSTADGLCRFDGTRFHRLDFPVSLGRGSLKPGKDGSIWLDGKHRIFAEKTSPIIVLETRDQTMESGGRSLVTWRGVDAWNRSSADALLWSVQIDDGQWSVFRPENQLILEGLSSGIHTVRIRGRDEDFNESAVSEAITVNVVPPIWKRSWFIVVGILLLATLAWLSSSLIKRGIALGRTNQQLEHARQQLAEQFEEKSAQFRAICDCSPIGIFVSDTAGQLSYLNRYLQRIVGIPDESARGDGWADALHPDDRNRIVRSWQQATTQREQYRNHGRFLQSDGQVIWFEVAADCIERDGVVLGYVGAVEDISERVLADEELRDSNQKLTQTLERLKHAQEQAIKRERLSALGQMAAGVAHDINNSLSPLLTYAELLANEGAVDDTSRQWAELIRLGVSDMSETVKRLDHFYRESHHRDTLESVDLLDTARQAIELTRPKWENAAHADGKTIDLRVDSTSTPTVSAVPSQIRSVLTNLIFNAVDAINERGTVTIRVSEDRETAVIEVQDDGPGMSPEQLDRCLEPFFTSKPKGSGLGLSECHGIVRQHGGAMQIESNLERGTSVRIQLPSDQRHAENPDHVVPDDPWDTSTAPDIHNGGSPTVLYVDDDEMVRESTAALFHSIGLPVQLAVDGPSALEQLEQTDFDLVMCDHGLPGMNGAAVLKEIKRRWPQLPVVIVSGWSRPIAADAVQPDAFLEKPVTYDDLVAVLKRHVHVSSL